MGHKTREYDFSDRDFNVIRQLVMARTGISLSEAKRDMVYSRLSRRLRQLDISTFKDYCALVSTDESEEHGHFVNAITTNLTAFFREEHHFHYLKDTLLPELMANKSATRQIRIWSAGCSTGEEPYSLAMVLKENLPQAAGWDVKILASDLDTNVLAKAAEGVYDEERVSGISAQRLKRWFKRGKGSRQGKVRVSSELRDMICFRQINLMEEWPLRGPFDFMFCRNVVIYFDKPTQRVLFNRYADLLADDARLFVGHSESLYKVTDRFELIGNTIYQKRK
ncbi:MAG: protein-glutamate O-methyltransferase CheR [Gammaproteobacteria bacterium]|nr:protein-glutamate O-methyltransferase CheR [Gammaproteobacteria bacterium]